MAAAADTTEAEPATALPASAATATAGELTVGRKIDSPSTVYDFVVRDITGNPVDLEAYKGKVLLIFNGASKCGFTGQYGPLEEVRRIPPNFLVAAGRTRGQCSANVLFS